MECAKKFDEQATHVHPGYQETVDYRKKLMKFFIHLLYNFSFLFLLELFVRLVIIHLLCSQR